MKNVPFSFLFLLIFSLILTASARGEAVNLVKNGSFETTVYTSGTRTAYGYVQKNSTVNGSVTDWKYTPTNYINEAQGFYFITTDYGYGTSLATEEFGKNCGPLDGNYTLFLQRPGTISQTVTGLTPGEYYTYSFKYDARQGNGNSFISANLGSMKLLNNMKFNSRNPFYDYKVTFRAASDTMNISFANTDMEFTTETTDGIEKKKITDNSLLVDAVKLCAVTENPWWYSDAGDTSTLWRGDASSGVSSDKSYTHTLNFGAKVADSCTLNDVKFLGVKSLSASSDLFSIKAGSSYDADGTLQNRFGTANPGSQALAAGFMYGFSEITLKDLMPGIEYTTTLYLASWNDTLRNGVLNAPDGSSLVFDENLFRTSDGRNGGLVTWTGYASENGTLSFKISALDSGNLLHIYGISNEITAGQTPDVTRTPLLLATNFGGTNGNGNEGLCIDKTSADICNFLSPAADSKWKITGGGSYESLKGYSTIQNGALRAGANDISMMNIDSSLVAGQWVTLSMDLKLHTLATNGGDLANARGIGVGFVRDGKTYNQEAGIGFSGLVVRPNGDLYFYENSAGNAVSDAKMTERIAYHSPDGNTFNAEDWYTLDVILSFSEDGSSAQVVSVGLSGSDADYSALNGCTFETTDLFAILSSSANSWNYYGLADNLRIGYYVPEPAAWVLLLAGTGVLFFLRKKRTVKTASVINAH